MKRAEHRAKARLLTQPHPARMRRSMAGAIVLKQDALFLVTMESGDVPFEGPHAFGLYLHDCRFLDGYTLRLNGSAPTALFRCDRAELYNPMSFTAAACGPTTTR
jgi:hypothetical protein